MFGTKTEGYEFESMYPKEGQPVPMDEYYYSIADFLKRKNNVKLFVGFSDNFFDESRYQELMNEDTGIMNHKITFTPEMIGDGFEDVIFHSEQPIFRTAPTPLYYLSELVNKNKFKPSGWNAHLNKIKGNDVRQIIDNSCNVKLHILRFENFENDLQDFINTILGALYLKRL